MQMIVQINGNENSSSRGKTEQDSLLSATTPFSVGECCM